MSHASSSSWIDNAAAKTLGVGMFLNDGRPHISGISINLKPIDDPNSSSTRHSLQKYGHGGVYVPRRLRRVRDRENVTASVSKSTLFGGVRPPIHSSATSATPSGSHSMSLVRPVSFLEAVDIIRFGHSSLLDIRSVVAGFYESEHLRNSAQHSPTKSGPDELWVILLVYLLLQPCREAILELADRREYRPLFSLTGGSCAALVGASLQLRTSVRDHRLNTAVRQVVRELISTKRHPDVAFLFKPPNRLRKAYIESMSDPISQTVAIVSGRRHLRVIRVISFLKAVILIRSGDFGSIEINSSSHSHHDLLLLYFDLRRTSCFLTQAGWSVNAARKLALEYHSNDNAMTHFKLLRQMTDVQSWSAENGPKGELKLRLETKRPEVAEVLFPFRAAYGHIDLWSNSPYDPWVADPVTAISTDIVMRKEDQGLQIMQKPSADALEQERQVPEPTVEQLTSVTSAQKLQEAAVTDQLLKKSIRRAIQTRTLLTTADIDHFLAALPADQRQFVLTYMIFDLERKIRVDTRTHRRARANACTKLLRLVQDKYNTLQRRQGSSDSSQSEPRPLNRFTNIAYATLEEELKGLEVWKAAELQVNRDIACRYARASRHPDRLTMHYLRLLARKKVTSSLKLQTVTAHIQRLYTAISQNGTSRASRETNSVRAKIQPSQSPYLPYNVSHHIFGNIMDDFKEAMFGFGQREFPATMKSLNWTHTESIALTAFTRIMVRTFPDLRHRYEFFKQEFDSLALIRNAHAHAELTISLHETRVIIDDLQVVAITLGFNPLMKRIKRYRQLLAQLEEQVLEAHSQWEVEPLAILLRREAMYESKLKRLTSDHHNQSIDLKLLETEKKDMEEEFAKHVENVRRAAEDNASKVVDMLSQDLLEYAIKNHIERSLTLLPVPKAAKIIQRLSASYTAMARSSLIESSRNKRANDGNVPASIFTVDTIDRNGAGLQESKLSRPRTLISKDVDVASEAPDAAYTASHHQNSPQTEDPETSENDMGYSFLRDEQDLEEVSIGDKPGEFAKWDRKHGIHKLGISSSSFDQSSNHETISSYLSPEHKHESFTKTTKKTFKRNQRKSKAKKRTLHSAVDVGDSTSSASHL